MSRATTEQADLLHKLVAEALIEQIQAWRENRLVEPAKKGEGDIEGADGVVYVRVFPAPLLAQAVKFLKDNEVTVPEQSNERIDRLRGVLPSHDELDGNVVPFHR